jgi:5-methyltetrahydropteroyltriglutamate--homocysteine methyltransferase
MKTQKTSQLPPFFTQVIGSLPRPALVKDLLAERAEMDPKRYAASMDDMIRFAIRLQEQAGLDVISDGEWRRVQYVDEFLDRIGGFEKSRKYEHAGEVKYHRVAVHKIESKEPVFAEDARFLVEHTDRVTKFALPSPFLVAIRYWHADYSGATYPTYQDLMFHLADVLRREAEAVVAAGVDIIQLDDPAMTYFCDRHLMAGDQTHDERLRRGWDIEKQMPEAVEALNRIVDGLPAEVHLHCCHSVYKRSSDVTGDYKPLLPHLQGAKVDRVNLEFAYQGTGDSSDLQYLPDHLDVGMGVVDVRSENLQSVEEIEAIGAAGAQSISPSRIALNPDCGFAPDAGEPPTIDEAFEKLQRLCIAARNLRTRFA